MFAWQEVFEKTSTAAAPWYLVPADNRWYSRAVVSELLRTTLKNMNMTWPPSNPRWTPTRCAAGWRERSSHWRSQAHGTALRTAPPAGGRRRIATEGGSCRRNRPLGRLSIMTDEKEYGSWGGWPPNGTVTSVNGILRPMTSTNDSSAGWKTSKASNHGRIRKRPLWTSWPATM